MKRRTVGISHKMLVDLIVTGLTFALALYGIDLDATTSAVLAKAAGFVAGWFVRPNPVVTDDGESWRPKKAEVGQSLVEALLIVFLALIILVVVFRLV